MSAQTVILLEQVRVKRDKANHVRKICFHLTDAQALEALQAYAAELEHQAAELEAQAARHSALASDIVDEVKTTTQLIADIKETLSKI